MRKNYVNVSIPSELVDKIDAVWTKAKKGYRSRAEFILEAIREKMDREAHSINLSYTSSNTNDNKAKVITTIKNVLSFVL